jgi:YHS domain-containing protein
MDLKTLPTGSQFLFNLDGNTYYCTREDPSLDEGSCAIAISIKNPSLFWTPKKETGIEYYFLSSTNANLCTRIDKAYKEQLVKERIKKLWNESNYVRKYNAMLLL